MEFQHRFFREKAVKEYIQRQEKDFLPQFFALHRVILAYLLLLILLLATLLVWCSDVPLFITSSGVVLPQEPMHQALRDSDMEIVLFLPARYGTRLRLGETIEWQVDPSGRQFPGTIQAITNRTISPAEARKQFLLSDYAAQALSQPALEVILRPVATNMPHLQIGETVRAQVQIGSRHIF